MTYRIGFGVTARMASSRRRPSRTLPPLSITATALLPTTNPTLAIAPSFCRVITATAPMWALPHAPRPANLPPGTIWREKPRRNIPGSCWLPDTGYGALAPATENYLRTNLARVTGGDRTIALVVYCLRDCWMSWNAAKRIIGMGYANVIWYPDGTDGWAEADLPLRESMPEPQSSQ